MRYYLAAVIVILGTVLAMSQQPVMRNPFSTNIAGTPVIGHTNVSITNIGSGINWEFFGTGSASVARKGDLTTLTSYIGNTNGISYNSLTFYNIQGVPSPGAIKITNGWDGFVGYLAFYNTNSGTIYWKMYDATGNLEINAPSILIRSNIISYASASNTWLGAQYFASNVVFLNGITSGGGGTEDWSEFHSMSITNSAGITNKSLTASQFMATDANQKEVSTLNAGSLTNVTATNVVDKYLILNEHATNKLTLNNGSYFWQPTNSCTVTNIAGQITGEHRWLSLTVHNTNAGSITLYCTDANARMIGGTNTASGGIVITTGKVVTMAAECYGSAVTNIAMNVQQ